MKRFGSEASAPTMRTCLTLVMLLLGSANASAAEMFDSVDITPFVEHFRKQVKTLNRPVTTYSWSDRSDIDRRWIRFTKPTDLPETSPSGQLKEARSGANLFWRLYGSSKTGYMYGTGLYTAVDPAATQSSFAGEGDDWQVFEIVLPAGSQILDLANSDNVDTSDTELSEAAKQVEARFDCPIELNADKFFVQGGNGLEKKCSRLVYHTFKTIFKIDAFAYQYTGTSFKECSSNYSTHSRAFVVTSSDWMNSSNTRIFRPTTKGYDDVRIRIQTLLLQAVSDYNFLDTWTFKINLGKHFEEFPDRDLTSSRVVCFDSECVLHGEFCDEKRQCDEVELTRLPRPGGPLITAEEASKTRLLWPDLVGRPKAKVSTWLQKSTFGCAGKLPYENGKAR